jgi:hypothetical protein
MNPEQLISDLARLKSELESKEAIYKQEKKLLEEEQKDIVNKLHAYMSEHDIPNMKSSEGTVYFVTNSYVSKKTGDDFIEFIKSSQRFDLLKVAPLTKQVIAYIEETGTIPPGIEFQRYKEINFKKA